MGCGEPTHRRVPSALVIRHMALFTWNPGTTAEQVAALCDGLAAIPSRIPEIRSYRFGSDLGLGGNGQVAVVADFDDADGYRAYARHPDHQRVIAEMVAPIRADRLAVQIEL